jgi:hypothetical protein
MRKPKPNPKNPFGLTTAEILRHYFHRAQIKRRRAEPEIRARREAEAEAAHLARLDRQAEATNFLERRLRWLARYPSAAGVRQLAQILRDPKTPEHCRVKASQLILRLADYGDGPSPECPHSEDTRHEPRPRSLPL